jgi:Holliday junction resolvasome RuvABC endonuclease subunit
MRKRPAPAICGLDLSLTYPAAVVIPEHWDLGDWSAVVRLSWEPLPVSTLVGRYGRMSTIVEEILGFVLGHSVREVAVEDYAFSKSSSSVTKLAELGGHARCEFMGYGRVLQPITASHARVVLLGKLPRGKGMAKKEVQRRLMAAGADWASNDNEADAFAIANAHLSDLGFPCVMLHE